MSTSYETDQFTIRTVSASDGHALYEAVNSNRDRLSQDFPNLVAAYASEADVIERTRSNSTQSFLNSQQFEMLVATDPENTVIFGVGTRQELGRRALLTLPIKRSLRKHPVYSLDGASLVAGWTVEGHPAELPVTGLRELLKRNAPVDVEYDSNYANVTFIRPGNVAARLVAEDAEMTHATYEEDVDDAEGIHVGSLALRLAGIDDGIRGKRQLWVKEHPYVRQSSGFVEK